MIKNEEKGQIRFTNESLKTVKKIFQANKVKKFLAVSAKEDAKPSGFSEFYERLLGKKQNPNNAYQVYTNDWQKTNKLFNEILVSQGNLGLIMNSSCNCVLYITDSQKDQYNYLKMDNHKWPMVFLNEENSQAVAKYESLFKTHSVELSKLLLDINN